MSNIYAWINDRSKQRHTLYGHKKKVYYKIIFFSKLNFILI